MGHSWGDSPIVVTSGCVTLENHPNLGHKFVIYSKPYIALYIDNTKQTPKIVFIFYGIYGVWQPPTIDVWKRIITQLFNVHYKAS